MIIIIVLMNMEWGLMASSVQVIDQSEKNEIKLIEKELSSII